MKLLPHERLLAYRTALELAGSVRPVCEQVGPEGAYLAERLERAALAMMVDLAEGAAAKHDDEKAHAYVRARRHGFVCGALLALCRFRNTVPPAALAEAERAARRAIIAATEMTLQFPEPR